MTMHNLTRFEGGGRRECYVVDGVTASKERYQELSDKAHSLGGRMFNMRTESTADKERYAQRCTIEIGGDDK